MRNAAGTHRSIAIYRRTHLHAGCPSINLTSVSSAPDRTTVSGLSIQTYRPRASAKA